MANWMRRISPDVLARAGEGRSQPFPGRPFTGSASDLAASGRHVPPAPAHNPMFIPGEQRSSADRDSAHVLSHIRAGR